MPEVIDPRPLPDKLRASALVFRAVSMAVKSPAASRQIGQGAKLMEEAAGRIIELESELNAMKEHQTDMDAELRVRSELE